MAPHSPDADVVAGKPKGLVAANCSQSPSISVSLTNGLGNPNPLDTDRGTRSHVDVMEAGAGTARVQGTMHANRLDRQALAA